MSGAEGRKGNKQTVINPLRKETSICITIILGASSPGIEYTDIYNIYIYNILRKLSNDCNEITPAK